MSSCGGHPSVYLLHDNFWCSHTGVLLTLVDVLWALDSRTHLATILHYLAQLQTLDPLRYNYYADMSE